jgi:hypothetical protein
MVYAYMMNRLPSPDKRGKKVVHLLYFIFRHFDACTGFMQGQLVILLGGEGDVNMFFECTFIMFLGTPITYIWRFAPFFTGTRFVFYTDAIASIAEAASFDCFGKCALITKMGLHAMESMLAVIIYFSATPNLLNGDIFLYLFCYCGGIFRKLAANRLKRFVFFQAFRDDKSFFHC